MTENPNFLSSAFPQSPYPKGWFVVAESRDVAAGEVKPLKYFGRDLVLWRGESGQVYLMDANCLHLGAHMGYRGDEEQRKLVPAVVGEDIACPWHAWRWNGQGRNTCIPYKNEKPKSGAKIRTYPVKEWHGLVICWYSWDDCEPEWEVPAFPVLDDPSFFPWYPSGTKKWVLKGHCQTPIENSADFSHIHFVHGSSSLAEPEALLCDKHRMVADVTVLYGRPDKKTTLTDEGGVKATLRMDHYGIGISIHQWGDQLWPAATVASFTPIDDEHYEVVFRFICKRAPGESGDVMQGKAARMFKMQTHVIEQDFFIWDHGKRLENAMYAASEVKLYGRLRYWCLQFYPETAAGYVCPKDDLSVLGSLDDRIPLDA